MPYRTFRPEEFSLTGDGDRVLVTVPWDAAELLRDRLRGQGVRCTLVLDPLERRADLMPWGDMSPDRLVALLAGEAQLQPAG